MSIDEKSREYANKVLIIFFIIVTILTNLIFIIKYIRVPRFFNVPGICMRMGVAAANIFLALFSYVVTAKSVFDGSDDLNCGTISTALVYADNFLPFVFGCSLALQCCYLYFANSLPSTLNPKIQSLAIVVIPWILGILIVCPLTTTGYTAEIHCLRSFTFSRSRANMVISVTLPACFAVLFSIILYCKPTTHAPANLSQNQAGATINPLKSIVTTSYPSQPNCKHSPPENEENQNSNQYPHQYPQQYPQQHSQASPQQPPQPHFQAGPQQHFPQFAEEYPQQYPQRYPQQNPVQNPINALTSDYGPVFHMSSQQEQTNGSTFVSPQSITSEKRGLVLASLIFFFSVLPWECFTLGYVYNQDRSRDLSPDSFLIISDICSWALFIYPTLVPLAWIRQIV